MVKFLKNLSFKRVVSKPSNHVKFNAGRSFIHTRAASKIGFVKHSAGTDLSARSVHMSPICIAPTVEPHAGVTGIYTTYEKGL